MPDEDIFRKTYQPTNKIQQALITDIKNAATELIDLFVRVDGEYDTRCGYLARTKLEEAVMWAVKGVTSVRGKNNGQQ